MDTINQSANSLMEVINNILDFSKIESGKLELHVEKINLSELLHQVIDLIQYEADNKKLDLRLTIEDKVPTFVWMDYIRIKQILINLLSNAIKFTEKGSIDLTVHPIQTTGDHRSLRSTNRSRQPPNSKRCETAPAGNASKPSWKPAKRAGGNFCNTTSRTSPALPW